MLFAMSFARNASSAPYASKLLSVLVPSSLIFDSIWAWRFASVANVKCAAISSLMFAVFAKFVSTSVACAKLTSIISAKSAKSVAFAL